MHAAKTLTTAAAAILAAIALTTVHVVDAGTLALHEHADLYGLSINFDVKSYVCYTFPCFNDVVSSASWYALNPEHKVYFFTDAYCKGSYKDWPVRADQPSNFQIDDINDQISSVLVSNFPNAVYGHVQICSERAGIAGINASEPTTVAETPAPTALAAEGH